MSRVKQASLLLLRLVLTFLAVLLSYSLSTLVMGTADIAMTAEEETQAAHLTHFWDLLVVEDPNILPFQLLRGALWTALAMLIVLMIEARRWATALAVGLTFAVLLAVPLGSFPNPHIPSAVAQSHFYEIFSSMLLFGSVAGWVMYAPPIDKVTHLQSEVL